jgi:hypothetical protein
MHHFYIFNFKSWSNPSLGRLQEKGKHLRSLFELTICKLTRYRAILRYAYKLSMQLIAAFKDCERDKRGDFYHLA